MLFRYRTQQQAVQWCSSFCQDVLGYSAPQLAAADLAVLLHPESLAQLRQHPAPSWPAGRMRRWCCQVRHRDGHWRWLRLRLLASQHDEAGLATELTGSAEDVTHYRAALLALRALRQLPRPVPGQGPPAADALLTPGLAAGWSAVAEDSLLAYATARPERATPADAQAKEDFLANMSHEIRTPLHGILGLTSVLARTSLSRSQHDYLRLLGQSAEHLLTVLNDVLTTARLGAGKLQPEATAFGPVELLRGCVALLRPRAREKGLRLRSIKPTALPQVLGDAHRLRQVLLNLVSNAIKFTHQGEVVLSCELVAGPAAAPPIAAPDGLVWLRFAVRDTGVGIAPEALDKVFEPFAQAAASTDREYGGSGLGLSISEGLVKLLGGALRVSSAPGVGSTFAFVLPLPLAPAEPVRLGPDAEAATTAAQGSVLLVEDNLVNSLLAETVLRNWGWQVTTAASGPAAIALFEHRAFDLVLMDIQMPGMDGEAAAQVLRAHPDPARAATPIIALTARAQAGEAERLLAGGFAGYLAKPYREEQLLDAMRTVLTRHSPPTEITPYSFTFSAMPASPLYDLSNVRQLVRHDEAIVRRLSWAFIETTPAILTALDEALTQDNWEAVGDAAHHLKSSLDGLGVSSLHGVIREVEAYGTSAPEPAHAARQITLVRTTTEQVMAALRQEFPERA